MEAESATGYHRTCPVCNKGISIQQIVRIYGVDDDLDSNNNNINSNNSELHGQGINNRIPRKLFLGVIDVGFIGDIAAYFTRFMIGALTISIEVSRFKNYKKI